MVQEVQGICRHHLVVHSPPDEPPRVSRKTRSEYMCVVNNTGFCWFVMMAAPNGHSHCQHLLLGACEAVPIVDGELLLGQWQHLFLVELDRAREREVVVRLVGE